MPLDGEQDLIAGCRQPHSLPPDIRYVLDGMLDDWQLDEGSYLALNLFVPRSPILAILDDQLDADLPRTTSIARSKLAPALLDLVDTSLRELPQPVYDGLAAFSLGWMRRDIHGLAEIYAQWVHEDETTGGCLKAWKRGRHRRITRSGEVWPRTARRIRSPAFIARFVKRQDDSLRRRVMANRILDRAERVSGHPGASFGTFTAEIGAQREADRVAAMRQFWANRDPEMMAEAMETGDARVTLKKSYLRQLRRRRRRDRAVIKRALNVASAVLSDAEISGFARGEFVRLPGQTMDLVVKAAGRVADRGHGALAVYVTRPGDTSVLAHLCTYVEDTPALDQLVAFALAMKAGEEADVIHNANITQMLPEGRDHPLLAARETRDIAAVHAPTGGNAVFLDRFGDRMHWSHEEQQAREAAYWNETKHIWLERLAVFACGRRVKMLVGAVE